MKENRKYKRYLLGHEAVVVTQNTHELFHAKARDISARGVCLISDRPLPECQNCKISVALGDKALDRTKGEYVEFIAQAIYQSETAGQYRYGLKLVAIDSKYEEVLSSYLAWCEANEKK